jgi:hypothetical protein
MLSAQSLRDEMKRYANGEITADGLEEWLAAESWDMRRWAPRGLQHFIEAIQAVFIDFGDGKLSDQELRERLLLRYDQLQRAEEASKIVQVSIEKHVAHQVKDAAAPTEIVKDSSVVAA